ncbi:HEAT repeat domain-containing protein [Streptomyces sp. NRRL S-15]|uniref:HEAT repeat domain-containing protein n=1 Tax=Streptomyces sp. NRRL S-15 TaxID=1463886 RepID=UPI0004CBEEB4|nr:HEAT repeat domain-containing protein [Streptomyces sp. NRRL S-15]
MWVGLEAVDWTELEHNHGPAGDMPGLLRRCAGPDAQDAADAAFEISDHLFHQGGWICSAASVALPFLLRLAATPGVPVPGRRAMLDLVARLAAEAGQVNGESVDPGWETAWERALPEVLALLADPSPEIRRDTAHTLGVCGSPGESVLPSLLRCWEEDEDPVVRLDLVLGLGRAAEREPVGAQAAEVFDLLRELLDAPDPQIRLAAVHALAPTDPGLPVRRLGFLLEAIRDPSVELWRHTASVEADVQGVHHWTAALFTGPSPTFTLGLLDEHPDGEQRIGALNQAGGLLTRWRSPTAALLPSLSARLDDPIAEVRFRAVELLACLGPKAVAHADQVASLLEDTAARTTRTGQTVAEAAVWALARFNDPRCLPGLMEAMAGARSGFASAFAYYPVTDGLHHSVLPAIEEVLSFLPDHAELLLAPLGERLEAATDEHAVNRLCKVLAGWGPAAKAAVPQLLGLLEDDRTWAAAAHALAGIGRAGNGARDLLLTRSGPGEERAELAAWAYWKVGGDPGPALEAIGRTAAGAFLPRSSLRTLAGLGPHAARYADQLRTLTADADHWTRIEAAHALWAVTGDTETTVPAMTTAVRALAEGTCLPVALPALRCLALTGRAARPAAQLLRGLPSWDQRFCSNGGWRAFTQDEAVRAALEELFAACDSPVVTTI